MSTSHDPFEPVLPTSSSDAARTGDANETTDCKRPWTPPAIEDLPRLTDLTLQTGDGIPGGEAVFA